MRKHEPHYLPRVHVRHRPYPINKPPRLWPWFAVIMALLYVGINAVTQWQIHVMLVRMLS